MRLRTGWGPDDWTPNIPGAAPRLDRSHGSMGGPLTDVKRPFMAAVPVSTTPRCGRDILGPDRKVSGRVCGLPATHRSHCKSVEALAAQKQREDHLRR